MQNCRSQAGDSSTTDDNFISSLSNLPTIYHTSSSPQNQFSSLTLQTPDHIFHPQTNDTHILNQFHIQTPRIMSLEETMASIAAGQSLIVESMSRLMARLEESSPRQHAVNDLTAGIGNINLDRSAPPHQQFPTQGRTTDSVRPLRNQERASYAPAPPGNYRLDSPSEGAYARDPTRSEMAWKEPRIRDNLKFTGESKLLRQFLLDIYDTLEQFSYSFSSDRRRINWIAAHLTTSSSDVSPSQSWFLSLLMRNAQVHGIADPYANLKSLEYVIPPLLSTDAFIQELIHVFGDKMSSKTAIQALSRCKQGNSSIIDYNARYTSLAFHVIHSEEDSILKYVSGLQIDVHMAAIHLAGWTDAVTLTEKQALAIRGAQIVDEISSLKGHNRKHNVYQHPNSPKPTPIPVQFKTTANLVNQPVPMEIDAVVTKENRRNPFPAIRSVCIKDGLCF